MSSKAAFDSPSLFLLVCSYCLFTLSSHKSAPRASSAKQHYTGYFESQSSACRLNWNIANLWKYIFRYADWQSISCSTTKASRQHFEHFFSEMISKYFDMSNMLVNNMPQTCPNHHHDISCKANKSFSAFAHTADNSILVVPCDQRWALILGPNAATDKR